MGLPFLLVAAVGAFALTGIGVTDAATPVAPRKEPYAVLAEPRGTLLVADGRSGRIVRVDPRTGRRSVFARRLGWVYDLAHGRGGVYASTSSRIWRLARGRRHVIVRGLNDATGLDVAADGSIYVVESSRNRVLRIDGRTRRRVVVASTGLDQPIGIELLKDGSLLLADSHHGRVVRVGQGGQLEPCSRASRCRSA